MPDKFIKNTIYVVLSISLIGFILILPYNLICKISQSCQPISLKSLSIQKNGQQQMLVNFQSQVGDELKNLIEFTPEKTTAKALNGKIINNIFIAKNLTNKDIIIASHFKVEPQEMEKYLERIECLCFQNQLVKAGQNARMNVSFRINPAIEKDQSWKNLDNITISYEPYLAE